MLTSPITDDLIIQTLKSMKKHRSLGPDGMPVEFYLDTWHITEFDFCKAIKYFNTGYLPKSSNTTAIALIPKVPNPSSMGEFQPISLCTTFYKYISKIIANRMKGLMPKLINKAQTAFIPGRSISFQTTFFLLKSYFVVMVDRMVLLDVLSKLTYIKPSTLFLGILFLMPWLTWNSLPFSSNGLKRALPQPCFPSSLMALFVIILRVLKA